MTDPTTRAHAAATRTRRRGMDAVVSHECPGADLTIEGALCARTSGHIRMALHSSLAAGEGDLVLHLADAEVWDSAGLGVIVGAHHRAERQGRRLVVADASPRLCRLLAGTRLDRVLNVEGACGYVPLALTA